MTSIPAGKQVLEVEAHAIMALAENLNGSFDLAVDAIMSLKQGGRVIVSGMGKAGFIGMKISATLASIGIPSFFLHPAEAVHGDLGRYTSDDIALVFSNSGKTDEILRIVPELKRIACPIISITGLADSPLGKHSDVVLDIGKLTEAGPLGLAPTTSTTVMLALGDALAMAVQEKRGLTREDFARHHPGGALGASLTPVEQIMRQGDEHCIVNENMLTREVLKSITKTPGRPGAASIVDDSGILVAIFTDGDLRRWLDEKDSQFLDSPISEVMTRNPKSISTSALAAEALHIMSKHSIDQIIVVDDENLPVGMIDVQDLVDLPRVG